MPLATDESTRRRMRAAKQRDTSCELALRKALFKRGLRYRVNVRLGRARADIVFRSLRLAIFVDGCFWHRCPEHGTDPKRNSEWWRIKLDANVARDQRLRAALMQLGWSIVRIWEHEDPERSAGAIAALLGR
jgi:DNA mismatch endonuclease (patch repair protein)